MCDDKEKAFIFDIDGTIADISERRERATRANGSINWKLFYEGMSQDKMFPWAREVIKLLAWKGSPRLLFLTGRPEKYRSDTCVWLSNAIGKTYLPHLLFMRPDNDFTKDSDLKKSIYLWDIEPRFDVLAVFEDRARNVEMFRELGLICLQCDKGDF